MLQKRYKILAVFGVIALFLIAGCGGGGDEVVGGKTSPFLGGSQGLEISFLGGSPPDEVTDGDGTIASFPFQAVVSIRNVGEFGLSAGDVEIDLIGFLPSDFGVSDSTVLVEENPDGAPTARIKDSEGNIIEPVEVYKTFPTSSTAPSAQFGFKKILQGNTPFTFRANVCYKYQTQAVSDICVLENLVDVRDDAICDSSGSKQVYSSASPIGITAFRQSVAGTDKIQFSFDVVHSGSGNVFDPASGVVSCPQDSTTRRKKEDKIDVKVNTGITQSLNCGVIGQGTGGLVIGTVTLVDGKRTVTCTQDVSGQTDLINIVDITVDFNYLDKTEKKVIVKHLIG
jgi:hypothetical protein